MTITVLAGGLGGARMAAALRQHLPADKKITVVVNTADDLIMHGLNISPDIDTVIYALGGGLDSERTWGRADDSFTTNAELGNYGIPNWFTLGDKDIATHLLRTQMLSVDYSLTDVTAALATKWGLAEQNIEVLPMTDHRVATYVVVPDGQGTKAIHFQEWWVRHRAQLPALDFTVVGIDDATTTAAVESALEQADMVVIAPSNPIVSIRPILDTPGLREKLGRVSAPIVGVSPLFGAKPTRGMADICLQTADVPVSSLGIAEYYGARSGGGLLDGWLIDSGDADLAAAISDLGITCHATDTRLTTPHGAELIDLLVQGNWTK